jgi:hypothetical protein
MLIIFANATRQIELNAVVRIPGSQDPLKKLTDPDLTPDPPFISQVKIRNCFQINFKMPLNGK